MSTNPISNDIVSLIKSEHRLVDGLFAEFNQTSDPVRRKKIVEEVTKELCMHAAREEMFLYPKMRTIIDNGNAETDHALEEHQEAKNLLYKLDSLQATDPTFDTTMQQLIQAIQHHVKEEETGMLAKFEQEVDHATLVELGKSWDNYKMIAPSRPHPAAPNEGLPAILANATAKPIDEIRDAARSVMENLSK